MTLTKSYNIDEDYFRDVIINAQVDDLNVEVKKVNNIYISLIWSTTLEEDLAKHLFNKHNVNLNIVDETLKIIYNKQEIMFINNKSFIELIGLNIIIPKNKKYKIINNE